MSRKCPKCYLPLGDYDDSCPNCGANTPLEEGERPVVLADDSDTPMKWFKFIINFQLFATALFGLYTAYQTYTGAQYNGNMDLVYALLPDLKTADMIYLIVCVVLAAFAIFVRFQLSGYYQRGPVLYSVYMACFGIAPILRTVAYGKILETPATELANLWYPAMLTAIFSGVLLVIGIIYFKKRKELFLF